MSCRNDELCSRSEGLLRVVSYSGISDLDWRRDKRDGQYKVMDCNPRIGMNFRMFETAAAIDVVRALHLNLTGRSVNCSAMVEGRRLTVEPYYILSSIRSWHRMPALKREQAFHESRELGWWSSDDILPFFVMSLRVIAHATGRAFQSAWSFLTRRMEVS